MGHATMGQRWELMAAFDAQGPWFSVLAEAEYGAWGAHDAVQWRLLERSANFRYYRLVRRNTGSGPWLYGGVQLRGKF